MVGRRHVSGLLRTPTIFITFYLTRTTQTIRTVVVTNGVSRGPGSLSIPDRPQPGLLEFGESLSPKPSGNSDRRCAASVFNRRTKHQRKAVEVNGRLKSPKSLFQT
jgi:hypothetical protein